MVTSIPRIVTSIHGPYLIHLKTGIWKDIPVSSTLVLGREAGLGGFTVDVEMSGISRKHAECYYRQDGETVVIKDIGNKRNDGTFINDDQIARETEYILNNEDVIRIGALGGEEFKFSYKRILQKSELQLMGGLVYVRGTELRPQLPHVQYNMLQLLLDNHPFAVTFEELKGAWNDNPGFKDNPPYDPGTIAKNVQRLRTRLDKQLSIEGSIKSVRSRGYRLNIFP